MGGLWGASAARGPLVAQAGGQALCHRPAAGAVKDRTGSAWQASNDYLMGIERERLPPGFGRRSVSTPSASEASARSGSTSLGSTTS